MVSVIQVLGIAYILIMLYMSFLYYKKNNYSVQSFIFWVVVWAVGGTLLILPESISLLTQKISVARVFDFYLVVGLMFFSIITFLNFAAIRRTENKVEDLVRKMALQRKR